MGLAERRAIKAFQDNHFPALQKSIHEAAGFEVEVEVDWATLAVDDYSHLYDECFPKVYFTPVIDAFKNITQDEMGKEALAEGLEKVVIKNTLDKSNPSGFTFGGGVLTIDHKATSNVDDVRERTQHIVQLLEKAL